MLFFFFVAGHYPCRSFFRMVIAFGHKFRNSSHKLDFKTTIASRLSIQIRVDRFEFLS